ncbi:hypothetical protein [Frankia sp. Cj3]|uniref:hypothetical protein n=1 Tax=Frankia sp. Cj3 TaxID=2880976 RepID=UPI001EF700C8|nr:hypothetical protein [Frankia sp. Cj3]
MASARAGERVGTSGADGPIRILSACVPDAARLEPAGIELGEELSFRFVLDS